MFEDICGTYSILDEGEIAGELRVTSRGVQYEFDALCETAKAGPFRLAAYCDENWVPLGVMLPDGREYRFKKTYSKNALSSMGLFEINECQIICPGTEPGNITAKPENKVAAEAEDEPELLPKDEASLENVEGATYTEKNDWQDASEPWLLFADEGLSEACREVRGALLRDEGGGLLSFAVPLLKNKPFPAMPIFCFGEWMRINGSSYVVFRIKDKELVN